MFGNKELDAMMQNLSKTLEKQTGPKASFIVKEIHKSPEGDFELVVTASHPTIAVKGMEVLKVMYSEKKTKK